MSASVLLLPVPYLRDQMLCNWDAATALALADWLERTARDFAAAVKPDAPECPNCGEGCAGHPEALFCDRCGEAVESPDYAPCHCWAEALRTARALALSFGLAHVQLELPVAAPEPVKPWCSGFRQTGRCGIDRRHAPHGEDERPAWFEQS